MEEENKPAERNAPQDEGEPEAPTESTYPPRTWRTCCLAPLIAVSAILLLTIAAGLFSPQPRRPGFIRNPQMQARDKEARQRREVFVQFGRTYFAIAARADKYNEAGFKALEKMARGNGSLSDVHSTFTRAGQANARAAEEFRSAKIPSNLRSRQKLRQSLDTMSRAYDARRHACETIAAWNGDTNDRATAQIYRSQAEEINRLTLEGLRYLGGAADDNGLTREDVDKFLPAARAKAFGADAIGMR